VTKPLRKAFFLAIIGSFIGLLAACSSEQDRPQYDQSTPQNELGNFEISNFEDYKFYLNDLDFLKIDSLVKFDLSQTSYSTQSIRQNDQFYCLLTYIQPYEKIRALDEGEHIKLENYVDPDTAAKIRSYRTPFRYGQIETRVILVVSDVDFEILQFSQQDYRSRDRSVTLNGEIADDQCIYAKNSEIRVTQDVIDFRGVIVR
jgi:hypothetical protein